MAADTLTDRADIEQALVHTVETLRRQGDAYAERAHQHINHLLDRLDLLDHDPTAPVTVGAPELLNLPPGYYLPRKDRE